MGNIKIEDIMQGIRKRAGEKSRGDPGSAFARLQSSLAVAARAHDQLPPVTTYRRGVLARTELWIKRQLKRATHWYTWEQVNFNSAVNRALNDTLTTLQAHEQQLASIRDELHASVSLVADCQTRLAALESSFRSLEARLAGFNTAGPNQSHIEHQKSIDLVLNEQRVCFKQLSLEIGETGIVADRAKRSLQLRLDELEGRVEEIASRQTEAKAVGNVSGEVRDLQ